MCVTAVCCIVLCGVCSFLESSVCILMCVVVILLIIIFLEAHHNLFIIIKLIKLTVYQT